MPLVGSAASGSKGQLQLVGGLPLLSQPRAKGASPALERPSVRHSVATDRLPAQGRGALHQEEGGEDRVSQAEEIRGRDCLAVVVVEGRGPGLAVLAVDHQFDSEASAERDGETEL